MDDYFNSKSESNDQIDLTFPRFLQTTYGLSKSLQQKLASNKIRLKSEIDILSNEELVERFGFNEREIREINSKIRQTTITEKTFCDWQQQIGYIQSGSKGFDSAFGHSGLPTGCLTQLSGEAGVGKSQFCMKLCFAVQLPLEKGGLEGEALYLDTEDAFRPDRIIQIATNYFKKDTAEQNLLNFKVEEVLTRVHVRKVKTSADDLCHIILNGQLDEFFEYHSNVRLFVLDSIAYHFRYDNEDHNDIRVQQLIQIASKLKQLAFERNIAIIITNHVKFTDSPVLGTLWNSMCRTSLLLKRIETGGDMQDDITNNANSIIPLKLSQRQCSVLKSSDISNKYSFNYSITENGIEDS